MSDHLLVLGVSFTATSLVLSVQPSSLGYGFRFALVAFFRYVVFVDLDC